MLEAGTTDGLAFIDRERFFTELEPRLTKVANRLHIHDAAGEAKSWFLTFAKIFDQIQASPNHLVFQDFKTGGTISDHERIKANVVAYMMTSFRNALTKRDGFERHRVYGDETDRALPTTDEALNELIDNKKLMLSDLIEIIDLDRARAAKSTTMRGLVNFWFIDAVLTHYQHLQVKLGDFPIVRDIEAETPGKFFVREVVEGRFAGIRAKLENVQDHPREDVKEGLGRLLDTVGGPSADHPGQAFHATSGAAALRQKIRHYFTIHHGGLHKRLLKRLITRGTV